MSERQRKHIEQLIEEREPARAVHADDLQWKKIRWPGEWGKIAFHPSEESPTAPLCGITYFEPGGHFPTHAHDFAQVWYVIEGECEFAGKTHGPGTMVYHPDPHVELELRTEKGVTMFFAQYPGPNTGARPIYADRFDLEERRDVADEPTLV